MNTHEHNSRRFDVFTIREYMQEKQIKTQWTKVGVAFENRDGSWNLRLHVLPLSNPKTGLAELHMRPPRPKEDQTDGTGNGEGFDFHAYDGSNDENLM